MSEVKVCFISRFPGGKLLEVDLSQIEIVCLAFVSGDEAMRNDVIAGVDFHCKRLAQAEGVPYKEVVELCKADPKWKSKRTDIKRVSFQRSYGAGAPKIAEALRMPEEDVRKFIAAENALYPNVNKLYDKWNAELLRSSIECEETKTSPSGIPLRKGTMVAPNGRLFSLWQEETKDRKTGSTRTVFMPTKVKNYIIQGFAQDIIKAIEGKLLRTLVADRQLLENVLPIMQTHDDLKFDISRNFVDRGVSTIRAVFDDAPSIVSETYGINFDLPLRYSMSIGDNLLDREDI